MIELLPEPAGDRQRPRLDRPAKHQQADDAGCHRRRADKE
jgi:hypothetical protein